MPNLNREFCPEIHYVVSLGDVEWPLEPRSGFFLSYRLTLLVERSHTETWRHPIYHLIKSMLEGPHVPLAAISFRILNDWTIDLMLWSQKLPFSAYPEMEAFHGIFDVLSLPEPIF